jgi:hypothetical protein
LIWIKESDSWKASNGRHSPEKGLVSSRRGRMNSEDNNEEGLKIPLIQQLLDNPFLLLFLGVLIPMVVYVLWGVIDILTIPLAP